MRISVLASSSRGNASVISAGDTVVMVDAGISARRITQGLAACGLQPGAVQGVFLTHEHVDHVAGLGQFAGKREIRVFCSYDMRRDIRALAPEVPMTYVEPGCSLQVGELRVTPFAVNHDAAAPLGYVFEHRGVRLGYVTDSGHVSQRMAAALAGVNALYVESNYDERMLRESGRPRMLIGRIEGPFGHLSNVQAGELVERLAHPGLRHVILGHLSPECNKPVIAERAMDAVLQRCCPMAHLYTAKQAERLDWIDLDDFFLES